MRDRLLKDRPVIMMELLGPEDCKGGFGSEAEPGQALYPGCRPFALRGPHLASLRAFNWSSEETVCLPEERIDLFRDNIA